MSVIGSDDPDFRLCQIDRSTLLSLQSLAEDHRWSTRWSSVDALLGQVKEGAVLLQTFMRQTSWDGRATVRCFVMFGVVEAGTAAGVATIDVLAERLALMQRLDHDERVRAAFLTVFTWASGGISMLPKP